MHQRYAILTQQILFCTGEIEYEVLAAPDLPRIL